MGIPLPYVTPMPKMKVRPWNSLNLQILLKDSNIRSPNQIIEKTSDTTHLKCLTFFPLTKTQNQYISYECKNKLPHVPHLHQINHPPPYEQAAEQCRNLYLARPF